MSYYDYIIVGSDPYGLTCAYYLSKLKKKLLLIDDNNSIGGNYIADNYCNSSFVNFKNLILDFGFNFYNLFTPITPLKLFDNNYYPKISIYQLWSDKIKKNNCSIKLNTKITNINLSDNIIKSININSNNCNDTIYANNFIFSKYIIKNKCINIYYHWDTKLNLQKNNYFNKTDWMITYVVLSDYTYFYNVNSFSVILVTINNLNYKSKFTNKTVNESNDTEIINESFRQLKQLLINLKTPIKSTIYINKNYNNYNIENYKNIKIFNDNYYNFESLVINGIKTVNELEKTNIKIYREDNIIEIIQFLLLISFILYIFKDSLK
jgi:hypothetical protein